MIIIEVISKLLIELGGKLKRPRVDSALARIHTEEGCLRRAHGIRVRKANGQSPLRLIRGLRLRDKNDGGTVTPSTFAV